MKPKVTVDNHELMALIEEAIHNNQMVDLKVKGHSMMPFLRDNESVVKLSNSMDYKLYDIVLFKYNNHYFLHRIVKVNGDELICGGDGLLTYEHIKKEDIVAKVTSFITKDELIDTQDLKYIKRVKRWWRLRFLRRILLKWYRLKK